MTTPPKIPHGSHPLCPPKVPPLPCHVMVAHPVDPLTNHHPPPLAPVLQMITGWVSVLPGLTHRVVLSESTASTVVGQHTSTTHTHPTIPPDHPHKHPPALVSLMRLGFQIPTSTLTQPSWRPSTPWLRMEWLTLGRESPWRPGKPARITTPHWVWRWSPEVRSWVQVSSIWKSTPQIECLWRKRATVVGFSMYLNTHTPGPSQSSMSGRHDSLSYNLICLKLNRKASGK